MRMGCALVLLLAAACAIAREPSDETGAHPVGWADRQSPAFHATWLRDNGEPLDRCASCHGADWHGGAVGVSCESAGCHTKPPTSCDTCHGSGVLGAPPPSLDRSIDPSARGVGAHRRHLDETLRDRIGHVAACDDCHVVPTHVSDPGHIGQPPARVVLAAGGRYDPRSLTCVNACHFDRTPGPVWTDTSGTPRACDGCHAFPPTRTRSGTIHPGVEGEIAACRKCHVFDPSSHVDGKVDFAR